MIREIHENELKGLLELYLHLHESTVPEMTEQLNRHGRLLFRIEIIILL